jgi:hypothetical protein
MVNPEGLLTSGDAAFSRIVNPEGLLISGAQHSPTSSISRSLLTSGDAAFFRIAYPEAISLYESALLSSPQDSRLFWRLARVYVCSAEVEEDEAKRRPLLRQAEEYARRSIASAPLSSSLNLMQG